MSVQTPDLGSWPVYGWLALAVLLPLLARPGRRLYWVFMAGAGYPVLGMVAATMAAQVVDDAMMASRMAGWMTAGLAVQAVLWLLLQRVRGFFGAPSQAQLEQVDLGAAALLLAMLVLLIDPLYPWPLARLGIASRSAAAQVWLSLPPLLGLLALAGVWRGWAWGRSLARGMAVAFALAFGALAGTQFLQGLVVGGHSGIAFGGLFRFAWLLVFGMGNCALCWLLLGRPQPGSAGLPGNAGAAA